VVSESSLTSVVTELRAALGDEARNPRFVRTVYGFGYAFCGEAVEVADAVTPAAPRGLRLRLFLDDRLQGENILGRWMEGRLPESPRILTPTARADPNGKATLEGRSRNLHSCGKRVASPLPL
jgi:hypothetical protein